ncbi:ROK family transcriptional regulator [Bifidobacterium simiiventris]|uniref:ROK family transcriptional regulator n=1 Tax=Bifidobacterium simiiventris TaxID=2834434 RepID=UPI001C5A2578|nr:ROK family transcriptional regulator [Bifidobacterium simiiventris]MBW3077771.1 ROK family transcriptional regulator [Bifidobacterium simiiventris]
MNATATASQASISESNRSRILQHLYHNGISSRAQIAKALELTPAAITKITARLLEAGIITETGDLEGIKNRRSIGLKLDTALFHVVGVKFARSLVEIGLFDLAGNRISLEDLPTVSDSTIPATIRSIHEHVNRLLAADDEIVAIGIAVPGPYLRDQGRTAVVSSMAGWRSVNFIEEFADAFPVPVYIEQDARAGALAQYLFDRDSTCENLAYYLIGEGVGLGVIDNGRLIDGAQGAATEIGHISVDVHGIPCDCGNVGCLERYCSAVAVHEQIVANDLVPGAANMTHTEACRALFAAANDGDERSLDLVHRIGRYAGYGCVTILNAYNPERIVIGDIVSEAGRPLLDAILETVAERAIPDIAQATTITLSPLPTDATVTGAAAVAITEFLEHPSVFFDDV